MTTTTATATGRYEGLRVAVDIQTDLAYAGQIPATLAEVDMPDAMTAVGALYEAAASGFGIDLVLTRDEAESRDWTRGQDEDLVREAWQSLHDAVPADDINAAIAPYFTTAVREIGGINREVTVDLKDDSGDTLAAAALAGNDEEELFLACDADIECFGEVNPLAADEWVEARLESPSGVFAAVRVYGSGDRETARIRHGRIAGWDAA